MSGGQRVWKCVGEYSVANGAGMQPALHVIRWHLQENNKGIMTVTVGIDPQELYTVFLREGLWREVPS